MALDRKNFLKRAGGLALLTILPRKVLGGEGYTAPSDEITKGIIGMGAMGTGHFPYDGTRTTAVCDVDANRLKRATEIAPDKVAAYSDYRQLIADPNVDIVHIATPPHWHGIMAVEAANAGKDIFCEKPMTRTIGEGKRIQEAVKRSGSIFRLNTWFRFRSNFYGMGTTVKPLKKLVDSGLLGWPLTVTISAHTGFNWKFYWVGKDHLDPQPVPKELDYDMWLGPAPYKPYNSHRVHDTFRGYWDYDGGGLGDMGQHYLDPVQYFLNKDNELPIKVEVDAPQQHHDAVGTWRQIVYTYADGCKIILNGEDYGDKNAPYIAGPKGNVYNGFRCDIPNINYVLNEYPDPEPQNTDFIGCVKNREKFALNELNGFNSCTLVNMGLVALRVGRTLRFNPSGLIFEDDDAANRLIEPSNRAPWSSI